METHITTITFGKASKSFEAIGAANEWLTARHNELIARGDKRAARTLHVKIENCDSMAYRSFKIPAGRAINELWFAEAALRAPDSYTIQHLDMMFDIRRWGNQFKTKPIP